MDNKIENRNRDEMSKLIKYIEHKCEYFMCVCVCVCVCVSPRKLMGNLL